MGFVFGYHLFLSITLSDLGLLPGAGFFKGRHFANDTGFWFNKILMHSRGGLGIGAALFCVSVAGIYFGMLIATLNMRVLFKALRQKRQG